MKTKTNTNKSKLVKFILPIAIILAVVLTINILACTVFDVALVTFVGSTKVDTSGTVNGLDLEYSKKSLTREQLNTRREELSEQISAEGIVLLKNEGGTMPYAEGTEFSFFSHSSVDWLRLGTGSGAVNDEKEGDVNLKNVFKASGFKVNETLWDFYSKGKGKSYKRGIGSVNYGDASDFRINECPLSVLQGESGVLDSAKGTTAVFVLSRTGGEGSDLARSFSDSQDKDHNLQINTTIEADKFKHYLEPDSIELEILKYLDDNFDDVLLIVNSNNAVELGWTEQFDSIHNILWSPGTGTAGLYSLPEIVKGNINPSGRLVDTFAYDSFSSPAMVNFGDFLYYPEGKLPTGESVDDLFYYYVAYEEGIYVGYKYYETRYEDYILNQGNAGEYDYSGTVQYPFGYGLSYTDFEWSDFKTEWNGKECTVNVTVRNVGERAGKEVVQVYAQSPYTDYDKQNGVEKAAVQLVGFAKTKELKKGETETVTVKFDEEELKAYDAKTAKSYILDAGTYYITAAKDAHAAVNNVIAKKDATKTDSLAASPSKGALPDAGFVTEYVVAALSDEYATDTQTGKPITNQFDHATRSDITYLSRSDWQGTFPTLYGEVSAVESVYNNPAQSDGKAYQYKKDLSREDYNKIRSTDSLNPRLNEQVEEIKTDVNNGMELIDLRGLAFDDPLWEKLLDQLKPNDYKKLIAMSGYGTQELNSIKKPYVSDADGPSGFAVGYAYSTELMVAQTWNVELAKEFGSMIGEDALLTGNIGWYAPAMNIHRTPFSGRNNEYYSEDAFLSGTMGSNTVVGAAEKGIYTMIKHFAFNEQENHRGDRDGFNGKGEHGLVTWANEQSLREIYLRPFEKSIKSGTVEMKYYRMVNDETAEDGLKFEAATAEIPACNAIMTSFNRIGFTWTGGNYNLMTGVLRTEWGFNGFAVTDFDNGGYMDAVQMILAGGDGKLSALGTKDYNGKTFNFNDLTAVQKYYARQAAHRILYTDVNSAAMNGRIHGVSPNGFAYYKIILIVLDVLAAAGIGVLAFFAVRSVRRGRNKEESNE